MTNVIACKKLKMFWQTFLLFWAGKNRCVIFHGKKRIFESAALQWILWRKLKAKLNFPEDGFSFSTLLRTWQNVAGAPDLGRREHLFPGDFFAIFYSLIYAFPAIKNILHHCLSSRGGILYFRLTRSRAGDDDAQVAALLHALKVGAGYQPLEESVNNVPRKKLLVRKC